MVDIRKNENYTVEVSGMTHEGQGVGKINGFTVFIDGALRGETVSIRIIKINKTYAVGKLLHIIKEAPGRITPFCESYKRCGGCNLQHLSYPEQLKFKTELVEESIRRIGKLEEAQVLPTLGMENPLYYRNKAQYPVGLVNGRAAMGFYAARSHEIIDNSACGIQSETSDRIRSVVRDFILQNNISVYEEATGSGLLRHLMVRTGFQTGEVMVVLVINGRDLPHWEELVDRLLSQVPEIKSIMLNVNVKNTNVIMGDTNIGIYGKDTITDYIGRFRFEISPMSFYQVNPVQTRVLYGKALEYAGLTGEETVFDLYCGIGTISLFLSDKAKKVYGVEVVEEAILDARRNADVNGVTNAEFLVGEAEKVIPEMYSRGVRADVVVVDPPRKGCDEALLKTLVDMEPKRIVYVSCKPSTLARDLKYLEENGYRTVEVQPVDMFPQTAHTECCCLLERTSIVENKGG